jgi:hypothetical protein
VSADDDRLARLPAWARTEIQRLRANAARTDEKLAQVLGDAPGGRIVLIDYGVETGRERRVPAHFHVRYELGPERPSPRTGERYVADYIEVRHDGDRIVVRSGSHALAVLPQGSNGIAVLLDPEGRGAARYGTHAAETPDA